MVVRQGAIVDYQDSTIEYQIQIRLGDFSSRSKLTEQILKKIQSHTQGEISLKGVIEAWGFGLMQNENLKELGVIQADKNQTKISFNNLLSQVKSDLIVLNVKMNLPKEIRDALVSIHFSQNTRKVGNSAEAYFEVVLDYANLWKGSLDSFSVKNIMLGSNLIVLEESIESALPPSLKQKIIEAVRRLAIGDKNAMTFLSVVSRSFLTFQSEQTIKRLREMISAEPSARIEVVDVIPMMEKYELAGLDFPMLLPGRVSIRLRTSIREGETALTGKVMLDLGIFNEIKRDMANKIERESRSISF